MASNRINYRPLAFVLWGIVLGVAALSISNFYGVEGRRLIFPPILVLGVYLLLLNRLYGNFAANKNNQPGTVFLSKDENEHQGKQSEKPPILKDAAVPLTQTEKQKWLDDFLVRQQK